MPAHTGTWAQDIDARMAVGDGDGFPYIHTEFVRQAGKLVGNRDVHITGGIFHQFDHLGGGGIRQDDLAGHKSLIQALPALVEAVIHPTNNPWIGWSIP